MPKRQSKPKRLTKTQQLQQRIETQEQLLNSMRSNERKLLNDLHVKDAEVQHLNREITNLEDQVRWHKSLAQQTIELANSVARAR